MLVLAKDVGRENVGAIQVFSAWRDFPRQWDYPEVMHRMPATAIEVNRSVIRDDTRSREASLKWFSYLLRLRARVKFIEEDYVRTLDEAVEATVFTLPANRRTRLIELSRRIPHAEVGHSVGQLATARILWEYEPPKKGDGLEDLFSFIADRVHGEN